MAFRPAEIRAAARPSMCPTSLMRCSVSTLAKAALSFRNSCDADLFNKSLSKSESSTVGCKPVSRDKELTIVNPGAIEDHGCGTEELLEKLFSKPGEGPSVRAWKSDAGAGIPKPGELGLGFKNKVLIQ